MLRGSLVAIVTPMTADGSLDFPAWIGCSISTCMKAPTAS